METLKYVGITLLIFLSFCFLLFYYSQQNDEESTVIPKSEKVISTEEAIEQHKNAHNGEAIESVCTWCGGIGAVGYGGASEAQVRRTGMGLGNKCTTCKGTGKIKTYKK